MDQLVFLKLGGSLITRKEKAHTPRHYVLRNAAAQICRALLENSGLQLIIGHGSGSFGHFPAVQHQTRLGVRTAEEWLGFVEVWKEARSLNTIVMNTLLEQDIAAISFPPNAQVTTDNGKITRWNTDPLNSALQCGLVPVIYGDTVFDASIGGTILSTEELFEHLAEVFKPARILIAGTEEGVWSDYPSRTAIIPTITPGRLEEVDTILEASEHPDVTGGMKSKVHSMINLIHQGNCREVQIFSGVKANNIFRALNGESVGTTIHED